MNHVAACDGVLAPFGLVGDSPEIQRVLQVIDRLKGSRDPVLITGETGTGKELVARALHAKSPGAAGTFVAVNVAALPSSLVESELFGHVRGSFTGTAGARRGLMGEADGGTLFLDEIGDLALEAQPKLLRALQEGEVRPVGSNRVTRVEVRLIAATSRDLRAEVQEGRFRAELFYRLSVVNVALPPLRAHRQDVPLLVQHFLSRYAPEPIRLAKGALQALVDYDWPGNVRELENCIRQMVAMRAGGELRARDLPPVLAGARRGVACTPPGRVVLEGGVMPLRDMQRLAIQHALEVARGSRCTAAELLGISKTTLYRRIKEDLGRSRRGSAAASAA